MRPGQIVTVYTDPITRTRPEGKVRLIHRLDRPVIYDLELWRVQFVEGGRITNKWIDTYVQN